MPADEPRAATDEGAVFTVQLPVFSGPFRLLADLILDQKIDVCDVPVARVTERFREDGLRALERWSLEEATWFLAVCAALLELKVGRLLPKPHVDTEEDLVGGTSPDLLYARSLELAVFRRVAGDLAERMESAALSVARAAGPPPEFAGLYPDPMAKVTAGDLARIAAALTAPPPALDLAHVTPIRVTLSEALDAVRGRLSECGEARFRDLVAGCRDRIDVVVRFLAVLELYREGQIELSQAAAFGEIGIRWQPAARSATRPQREED